MCGITGYWSYAKEDLAPNIFASFAHSLAHRGPDGFGIEHFKDTRLWLGHRRLSIIDLSDRGRQPQSYADGRYWITFNGEVYNYIELREELCGLGHRFASATDTEVILAAYAQWGSACQLRFNGMWAFAIWDTHRRQLFLSRDRFGVKPLHYSVRDGAFAFASELKAFLVLPWVDGSLDTDILAETLINIVGQESTVHTLLPGVRRLPAGHAMLVHADGRIDVTQWWNTLDHLPTVPSGLPAQVDEFQRLLFDACRLRLRSDVPLATSLSGGLDSSAVACTIFELGRRAEIANAPKDWRRAFVACFKDTPNDEQNYARAIIEHTGMAAHYEMVDESRAVRDIEKVIFDVEQIFMDPKTGQWAIYHSMRENGVKVCLDGSGADELLGGYRRFVDLAADAAIKNFNLIRYLDLRRVQRGFEGGRTSIPREIKTLLRYELKRLQLLEPLRAVRARIRRGTQDAEGEYNAREPALFPYLGPFRLYDAATDPVVLGMTPLQGALYSFFHSSLLPSILCNFDRASMAHGIETRMPFMDWRLVTYGFALPEASKIGRGFTKRVLRAAMDGLMPDPIRLRTNKIIFASPLYAWTRGPLNTWVRDLCASRSFLDSSVWNGGAVRKTVEQAAASHRGVQSVWPILQAFVLEQTFKARAAASHSFRTLENRKEEAMERTALCCQVDRFSRLSPRTLMD
jgi:asparagine synthase (glutamine-hydrolysing)